MQPLAMPRLHRRPPPGQRQNGVTLVELMVAMAIGLVLVAGIAVLIANQSNSRSELDKSGRQVENGRYALTVLQADIQHAGYYGQYSSGFTAPTTLPNPCDLSSAAVIDAAMALPLQGYDAPATVPSSLSSCLPNADHVPGTDILVIRRLEADDAPAALASLVAGQFYVQATPVARVTGLGPDPNYTAAGGSSSASLYTLTQKDATTPAEIRRYVQRIYFVSPCNVYATGSTVCTAAADGGTPVPTLKRLELGVGAGGTPTFSIVPLVEGIQNMQLDYGIDSTGSGTPASPLVTAPAITDWPNVMTIQVNLLARNTSASGGYSDSAKTYSLGQAGSVGPFNDSYKRHVYSAMVRVINPSQQRE